MQKTKGLTVIFGSRTKKIIKDAFDVLADSGLKNTYLLEGYNSNIMDATFFALQNDLETVLTACKDKHQPVVVLIMPFDRMSSIRQIECIKESICHFIERMPSDVHIYVGAETYEMCRNEECLNADTGTIVRFKDYEEWRSAVKQS
jgi:hypothetical protein